MSITIKLTNAPRNYNVPKALVRLLKEFHDFSDANNKTAKDNLIADLLYSLDVCTDEDHHNLGSLCNCTNLEYFEQTTARKTTLGFYFPLLCILRLWNMGSDMSSITYEDLVSNGCSSLERCAMIH